FKQFYEALKMPCRIPPSRIAASQYKCYVKKWENVEGPNQKSSHSYSYTCLVPPEIYVFSLDHKSTSLQLCHLKIASENCRLLLARLALEPPPASILHPSACILYPPSS
ncbi:hypothetical protein ASZ78_005868, partial [Callipepla squamata]